MPQTLDNLTYTWNNSGTTFTGIKYNVTDTASAAGSLLMDLQVGGVSKLAVNKLGEFVNTAPAGTYTAKHSFRFLNNGGTADSGTFDIASGGGIYVRWGRSGVYYGNFSAEGILSAGGFSIGTNTTESGDVRIVRDAANTLAQRNGTNAQTSRLYGTYTDVSNYRRLTKTMSAAGVAEIKPEGAGTGATGNVLHISGLPTSNPGPGILWNDAGTVKVGT